MWEYAFELSFHCMSHVSRCWMVAKAASDVCIEYLSSNAENAEKKCLCDLSSLRFNLLDEGSFISGWSGREARLGAE